MSLCIPKVCFSPCSRVNLDKKLAYQTKNSGCFDIFSDEYSPVELIPGRFYAFDTGLTLNPNDLQKIELITGAGPGVLPEDAFTAILNICPRSGLAINYGIDVLGGCVDLDYKGKIKAILINHGKVPHTINPGDRICQARWTLCLKAYGVETKEVERVGGFGSTNG